MEEAMNQSKRGRIQRDTSVGEGIVYFDGVPKSFVLERHWRSEEPPRIGMVVDVEIDPSGEIIAIRAVSSKTIASEQASQALGSAQTVAKDIASDLRARGVPAAAALAQKIGYAPIGAFSAVLIGWFLLPAISVKLGPLGSVSATLFQSLPFARGDGMQALMAMSGQGSGGVYSLLMFVALIAVFLPIVWKDARAYLGLAAPLVFMLVMLLVVYLSFRSTFDVPKEAVGFARDLGMQKMMRDAAAANIKEMRNAISIGSGVYLAVIGALFLAYHGARSFFSARK
jgi:hypothetical protein